jgi:hypothetical protein
MTTFELAFLKQMQSKGLQPAEPAVADGELHRTANEKIMIQAYKDGLDLHMITGGRLNGYGLDDMLAMKAAGENGDEKAKKLFKYLRQGGKCYSGDTELLTPNGWVRFDEFPKETPVMTWGQDGVLAFSIPSDYQHHQNRKLVHAWDRDTDLLITLDHKQPLINRYDKLVVKEIQQYTPGELNNWSAIHAGVQEHIPKLSTDKTRLLVAVQADGYYNKKGQIEFGFSKDRKVQRLTRLLEVTHVPYTRGAHGVGVTRFILHKWVIAWIKKYLPQKRFTLSVWRDADRQAFLDELRYWDGRIKLSGGTSIRYCTKEKENAEILQIIAVTSGRRCTLNHNKEGLWEFTVPSREKLLGRISWAKNGLTYSTGDAYCVTVPTGFLLVRRNGRVTVSKNSDSFGLLNMSQSYK